MSEVSLVDVIKESWVALGALLVWALKKKSEKIDKLNDDVIRLKAVAATKDEVREVVKDEIEEIKKSTEEIKNVVTEIRIHCSKNSTPNGCNSDA